MFRVLFILLVFTVNVVAQAPLTTYTVNIPSSIDDNQQTTVVYEDPSNHVIVHGHSWGNNNLTAAVPGRMDAVHGFFLPANHLVANYRGGNISPETTGSRRVRRDWVDVKRWAKRNLDHNGKFYLQGTSGGGHAGLMVASEYPNAFDFFRIGVPVTDVIAWYKQLAKPSIVSNPNVYGPGVRHYIRQVCGGDPVTDAGARERCRKRSPVNVLSPETKAKIDIHVGIHDDVIPATHSLLVFNKLVGKPFFDRRTIRYVLKNKELPARYRMRRLRMCTEYIPILYMKRIRNIRIIIHNGHHNGCYGRGVFKNFTFKSWS